MSQKWRGPTPGIFALIFYCFFVPALVCGLIAVVVGAFNGQPGYLLLALGIGAILVKARLRWVREHRTMRERQNAEVPEG